MTLNTILLAMLFYDRHNLLTSCIYVMQQVFFKVFFLNILLEKTAFICLFLSVCQFFSLPSWILKLCGIETVD